MKPSRQKPYTVTDCTAIGCAEPQGKVIVFDIDKLGGKYKKPHYQHYYVSPDEIINSYRPFYGVSLYDGERVLINMTDVIGTISPDKLPAYAKLALSKLTVPSSLTPALVD